MAESPPGSSTASRRRIPLEEGFFTVPEDPRVPPRLLASRCPHCGECFFPRRVVCARCLHEGLEETEIGPRGRLWTWTWVHAPLFGSRRTDVGGYGVGQVDLPEGPRVQAVLAGESSEFEIGMELELDLETLREGEGGTELVIFRFRPIGAEA